VISLRIKVRIFSLSLAVILLAALFALSFLGDRAGYSGLMLVTRGNTAVRGITPDTAARLRDEGLLLTYEIPSHTMVEALNSRHSVKLIGTNSTYPTITGTNLISGGFFTQPAWDSQSRVAVLNENAAFAMFGSTNIDGQVITISGERWIITGVINDGKNDTTLNVYIPSSVNGGYIRSIMILMPSDETPAHVVNALGGFGIREGEYDFFNLSRTAESVGERFSVALKIAGCLTIILFGKHGLLYIIKICRMIKRESRQSYLRELVTRHKTDIAKTGGIVLLLFAGIALALNLSIQILATTLRWRDITLPVWYPDANFAHIIEQLRSFYTASAWMFGAYLLTAFVAVVLCVITSPNP